MGRLSVTRSVSATPQDRLRALAATATIGTDRFGGDAAAVETLLNDAATSGLRARAGWRPRIHGASLAPYPPDERPIAPAAAIARLQMLLAERDAGLLEEWAALAASHGVRVDGASAPLLLDWWARQPRRPAAVFTVIGRQGEWLAALNPDWDSRASATEIPADAETLWQVGTSAERLALLTSVRRLDPPRALALVQSTWDTEPAAERQKFVEVLRDDASMADEPFLEAALNHRSKAVRRLVAVVLLRIPGSRWRQRMTAAARQFITVQSSGLLRKQTRITLSPPESFDPAWERDGLEEQAPKGIGQRAWWLRLILTGADLAVWTERTGLTPAAVLEALQGDDFAADALGALVDAARLARDPDWCVALARHLVRQSPVQVDVIGALIQALSDADAERLALEIISADSLVTIERWMTIAAIERPWSPAFSREAMTMLSMRRNNGGGDFWRAAQLLETASRRLDPSAIDVFERVVEQAFEGLRPDTLARSLDRVRVRAEMRKEFSS